MHQSLLRGALLAAALLPCAGVARAQKAAPLTAQVLVATEADGFALLGQAGELIKPGPNGEPSTTDELSPAQNLRNQRLAVARNAPALAKLREALAAGIVAPTLNGDPTQSDDNTSRFLKARKLARLLSQEAAVRAADGDARGAVQSDLDSINMGVQIGRGMYINSLFGIAIEFIARRSLEQHVGLLDAAQSREVAAQLESLDASKATFASAMRAEKNYGLEFLGFMLEDLRDPDKRAIAQAEALKMDKDDPEYKVMIETFNLSPAEIEADLGLRYDEAVRRAALPYAVATQAGPIAGKTVYVDNIVVVLFPALSRFMTERDTLANRMLVAALRLRAIKLESGAYPATFDAGADPFSATLAPLVYKKTGDSYLLYSVGPDGVDDGGAKIRTVTKDDETGIEEVTDRLGANSTGDIVATVF